MKKNIKYSSVYSKIISLFFIYLLIIFYYQNEFFNITFLITSSFFIGVILFLINKERMNANPIHNQLNKLYYQIFKEKKNHYNLSDVSTSLEKIIFSIEKQLLNIDNLESSRSRFLGNVSHEIKTPLFILQGYIDTLISGAINDKNVNMDFLEKIKNQSDRLNLLMTDLIKISMIESDSLKLDIKKIKFDDIIKEIFSSYNDIIASRGDKLILPEDTNLNVNVDKEHMLCVFDNVIKNAINYSNTGDIIISAKKINNLLNIKITDHGIGIDKKHLDKIFERFYRVDSDRSRNTGGTGLGLAIVKHILRAHNIAININSEINIGTSISFSLNIVEN